MEALSSFRSHLDLLNGRHGDAADRHVAADPPWLQILRLAVYLEAPHIHGIMVPGPATWKYELAYMQNPDNSALFLHV